MVLEFELKSEIQKAIHAARKADPEWEMAEIEQAVAERFELPFCNDRIQIRDARIAYELDQGSRTGHEDIEVLTGIRVRLIALDYVLENSTEHYLELSPARLKYFDEVRRIPREIFTDSCGSLIAFLDSFPISLANCAAPLTTSVRFLLVSAQLSFFSIWPPNWKRIADSSLLA